MAQRDQPTIRPLVSSVTENDSNSSSPTSYQCFPSKCCSCFRYSPIPKSKASIVILLWNVLVSATLAGVTMAVMAITINNRKSISFQKAVYIFIGLYGAMGLVQVLFYPIGGLIADVRYGRYRTIMCSVTLMWCGYLCMTILSITLLAILPPNNKFSETLKIVTGVIGVPIAIILIAGFTGFQANVVQFGLDQLLDASSEELSVFLHWFVWTDNLGTLTARLVGSVTLCSPSQRSRYIGLAGPTVLILMSILLVLSYCKHRWFHSEPHAHNPYGTVYQVLKFVAKHDKPVGRRSALTYCDDERPTRMEFAKERFGGPFTTEKVEDVKTILRILIMLLAMGPIFYLHVANIYVFPLLGIHIGPNQPIDGKYGCQSHWVLLQSGNLSFIVSIVTIPIYIILVLPRISKVFPRILSRLGLGIALIVASVTSMLIIEGTGHYTATHKLNITNITCLFLSEYRHGHHFSQTLEFYTPLLLIPNLLNSVAIPLIQVTILEFISAQSPHTMKGLLLGIFYAVRGLFIILGALSIFPFDQSQIWKRSRHFELFNCGFYYYLVNSTLGFIGLLVFWRVARWYQYRQRDDPPYVHTYVEDYYSRYPQQMSAPTSPEEDGENSPLIVGSHSSVNREGEVTGHACLHSQP